MIFEKAEENAVIWSRTGFGRSCGIGIGSGRVPENLKYDMSGQRVLCNG